MTILEKKENFIQKAKLKFPLLDYSKVIEFTNGTKEFITIACPIHGEFKQKPTYHLASKYGCPECGKINSINNRTYIKYHKDINLSETFKNIKIVDNPIITNTNSIIGTIYCFINSLNNKVYIGKTVQSNYKNRLKCHKSKANSNNTHSIYFYNAINKHGWDSFNIVILYQSNIEINSEENKIKLDNLMKDKEKYYIKLFKSNNKNFGYNLTEGGEGIIGFKHSEKSRKKMSETRKKENHPRFGKRLESSKILQFDLDFNFVKEWDSTTDIHNELNYHVSSINRCCNNKLDTYKGFIWVKKNNYYEGYLEANKKYAKYGKLSKSVLQYDFLGNFIKEFPNCKIASLSLNQKSSISKAASGIDPQAFGFIWIYSEEFTEELLKNKLERVK